MTQNLAAKLAQYLFVALILLYLTESLVLTILVGIVFASLSHSMSKPEKPVPATKPT